MALLLVAGMSPAAVAETVSPVVTSPADGATVQAPLDGVAVSFDGVEPDTSWEISLVRDGGCDLRCFRTFTHTYTGDESSRVFVLDPAFTINGTYQVNISPVGGGFGAQQHFDLVGGQDYSAPEPVEGSDPVIVEPYPWAEFMNEWDGNVSVDFTDARPGRYDINVRDAYTGAMVIDFGPVQVDKSTTIVNLSGYSLGPGRYRVVVDPDFLDGTYNVARDFTVYEYTPEPTVRYVNVTQKNAVFYPLVRDGYRDKTSMKWKIEVEGDGLHDSPRFRIADKHGTVVKSGRPWTAGRSVYNLEWSGRDNAGDKVPPGVYKVTVTTADEAGAESSMTRKVEVATKTVTARDSITIKGNRFDSRSKSGNCRFYRDNYSKELTLDCWGGNYATAKYVARIPKDAVITRKFIGGEVNCCEVGRITKTITRPRSNTVVGVVRVTDWRSYTVWGLNVAYRYQKQM